MQVQSPAFEFEPRERILTSFKEQMIWLREKQARMERVSRTSEYATININSDLPIGIVLSSDWHIGSEATDYTLFENHMNMIQEEPNAYLVALSNTIDGYIWPGGIWSEVAHIPEQMEIAKQFAHEWKNKLLAVVGSRCHDWTKDKGAVSPQELSFMENIDAGMPFFTNGGVLTINLNGIDYSIGMTHKARFHSALNPTNANRQMAAFKWPVDIVAIAHHHVTQLLQTTMWEGPYKKDVVWARTGTYKIDDGYSKQEGFGEGQLGGCMVVLSPQTKKIIPFFRIEDGMEYLRMLRTSI